MIIKLNKPYEFEGQTYEQIELMCDSLSGQDLMGLKKKYSSISGKRRAVDQMADRNVSMLVTDTDFQLFVLSELSGQPIEFFTGLPCPEMISVLAEVQGFFFDSE